MWNYSSGSVSPCTLLGMATEKGPRAGRKDGRLLPPNEELIALREAGWTLQEIADHVKITTGVQVTANAVSAALTRAGHASKTVPRYDDIIPAAWRPIPKQHQTSYPLRMLRLYARVLHEPEKVSEGDRMKLQRWLEQLDKDGIVVAFCPQSEEGFFYVRADETEDLPGGVPVRPRLIDPLELT